MHQPPPAAPRTSEPLPISLRLFLLDFSEFLPTRLAFEGFRVPRSVTASARGRVSWGMKTKAQREYEARVRAGRGLAHPAEPLEPGLWSTVCERDGCETNFITSTRQRRYCSEACRRQVEQAKAVRAAHLQWLLVRECADPNCAELFVPNPHRDDHQFCSSRCRKRAHRANTDLSQLHCAWCGAKLPPGKTRRRIYCGPACRVRASRATTQKAGS